jgi:hypothetical protein
MKRIVRVIVSPAGEITIDAVGFQGADCESATKAFEEALGQVAERLKKPEYLARRTATTQQRLGR